MNRRNFITSSAKAAIGISAIGAISILSSCSSKKEESKSDNSFAVLRVSSDPYKSDEKQRFAFAIFNKTVVASKGSIDVTVTSPSKKKTVFKSLAVREKGIEGQGIYSFPIIFNEVGSWNLSTTFKGNSIELAFSVAAQSTAPALGASVPISKTPTNADPLDAEILCTRFKGTCELHDHSVDELLKTKKPFVVIFATPARCRTSYCGPVLDLAREVAKKSSLETVHIEIYKNETTADTLDAVKAWNLPSEPWIFGVNSEGKIDWRLDGAFDKSEIEELFERLK